ncbi:MAG TPA: CBS domain-containing protein [Sedimentisphaerales bacterium]|nr:CBS domain-containing protein [Sedimentisphaerales bacterium]
MENGQLKLIDVIEQMCVQKNIRLEPMRVARDIMNADVRTLTLDHTVKQCLKFMEARKVRHVPVVDLPYEGERKPYFVGVVSQRDVLRLNSPDAEGTGKGKIDQRALHQLLVQIVAHKPKSVSLRTPVQDVITTMTSNRIDMVPVLDDGDLVGIITTTDLMKLFLRLNEVVRRLCPELEKGGPPVDTASASSTEAKTLFSWAFRKVQEIMTEQVICLGPQDDLASAIKVLRTEELRHLPITDEQGKFAGLVSDRDILRNLPFAGRRPPSPAKKFREDLFAADPGTTSLQLPLKSIMVRKVSHILPTCSVSDAAHILVEKKISCLPVIDEQKKLRGMITVTDLMRELLAAYEPAEEAGLIAGESSLPVDRVTSTMEHTHF